MSGRRLRIGIAGTFDLENYGDLLFPLVAEAELSRRLGAIELHRWSYFARTPPDWPFTVRPLSALASSVGELDGMLIGGGHLIRFDKAVAPGYAPPSPDIHHPTGYWLTPALLALAHGRPVAWNAPGAHGDVPTWARPLIEPAIRLSRYVAVRDEPARAALEPFAGDTPIAVVPDTAFGVASLLNDDTARGFARLREALRLTRPYVVVQANGVSEAFCRFVERHPDFARQHQVVALPIGPIGGDDVSAIRAVLPGVVGPDTWPHPLLIAELIRGAAGVVGASLHLAITALAFEVPVVRPRSALDGKYAALAGHEGVFTHASEDDVDPAWFAPPRAERPRLTLSAAHAALETHWDTIARVLDDGRGRQGTPSALARSWQSLPGILETASDELERARAALVACQKAACYKDRA
jgi:lipopolysaccharide transport system ATP-binding protein